MVSLVLGESQLPQLLKKANMTQSDFAKQMGVSREFIRKIIHKEDDKVFSLTRALQAAYILDCGVEDLYEYTIAGVRLE